MGKVAHTGGIAKVNGVAGKISKYVVPFGVSCFCPLILNSRYKKVISYVPQDDIVLPELKVRENILPSARIRLPAN
jgi:ABC-type multidrug transport system ATPase subunit